MKPRAKTMTHKPTYEQLEQRMRELESAEREHRLAEEALQQSEAFIRAVMEDCASGDVSGGHNRPPFAGDRKSPLMQATE